MNTSLYLHPLPPLDAPPAPGTVTEALRKIGFLGGELAPGRYRVGDDFFRWITFAGCSPHLELEPGEEGQWNFTHLRLHLEPVPGLRIAPQRGRPRCPRCRAAVPEWKARLSQWRLDATDLYACPECGHEGPVAELDWRQYGVAARLLVELCRVWPGEAVPADALLGALEEATARPWSYAWAESHPQAGQAATRAASGSSSSRLTGRWSEKE